MGEESTETQATVTMAGPLAARPALRRGVSVARYLVVDHVGEGGMGIVYKAYDPELDRLVAIKLLHAGVGGSTDAARREQLLREGRALAKLSHPNVLAVYDVGTFEDDVFIATEFVEGPTLRQWLRQARRSRAEIVGAFLTAGAGLAAAHRAGLVHRDVKPANVLVGADGRVRVLDFGLAEPEGNAPLAGAGGTEPAIAGTPSYMAPEQRDGRPVDGRTDQFGFCVSLYEALYGELPFEGLGTEYEASSNAGRVRAAPPSADVPRWLRQIVVRGLASKPEDRWPSMDALLTELRRDRTATRRRWLGLTAALAVAIAATLAVRSAARTPPAMCRGAERKLAGAWDDARRAEVAAAFDRTNAPFATDALRITRATLDDYAARWTKMHTDACEATRVRGEQSEELLDLRMECLDGRLGEVRAQVDVLARADAKTVEKSVQAVRTLPSLAACADAAALRAPIRPPSADARARVDAVRGDLSVARAQQRAGRYAEALVVAKRAVDAAAPLDYRPLDAEALFLQGDLEDDVGDYAASADSLRRATAAAIAGDHRDLAARALLGVVTVVGLRQARFAEAHAWATLAGAAADRTGDPFLRGMLARNLGRVAYREGDRATSRAEIERCLSLWRPALAEDDDYVAGALTDLGNVAIADGRYDDATAVYLRSLAIQEALFGAHHPNLAANLNNLGSVYAKVGEWKASEASLESARALWEAALGPEHPKVALATFNLAETRLELGDVERARADAERALAIWQKAYGSEHPDVAQGLQGIADVQRARGDAKAALATYERALAMREKLLGPKHDLLVETLLGDGLARLALGDAKGAAPLLARAAAIDEANAGDPIELGQARLALARATRAMGDSARAREIAGQARGAFATASGARARALAASVDAWLAETR